MKTSNKNMQELYHFEPVNNIVLDMPKRIDLPYQSKAFEFLVSWFIRDEIGEARIMNNPKADDYLIVETRGYSLHNCQYWRNWVCDDTFISNACEQFYDMFSHLFVDQLIATDLAVLEHYDWKIQVAKFVYNLNKDRYIYSVFTIHHRENQPLSELHVVWDDEGVEKNLDFFTSTYVFKHFGSMDNCLLAYGGIASPDVELSKEDSRIFIRTLDVIKNKQSKQDKYVCDTWVWNTFKDSDPIFVALAKKAVQKMDS